MRIALTADPELPVPPVLYGGIERIVDMLARGLVARGHDVTVFAHAQSATAGRLLGWPGRSSRSAADTLRNSALLTRHVLSGEFDIVHSFSRVAYMAPVLLAAVPKLMTYQRPVSRRSIRAGSAFSRGTLWFSAISRKMMQGVADIGTWRLVYNGVPMATYTYCGEPGPDAPLVFLGRVEQIKGPHLAIEIAKRTGIPLVIAGNVPNGHRGWFEANVAPHVDGKTISYVGPLNDVQKNALLGKARALLMPILWEEPFGIVMAEALACGTPVVGLARGAVPEVVEHGVSGFVADTVDGLAQAIPMLSKIDRMSCRTRAEQLFSDRAVVDAYLAVYKEMRAGLTTQSRRVL